MTAGEFIFALSERGFLRATLWNLCVSVVKIPRTIQPQRPRDRTENHRAYFPDRLQYKEREQTSRR